MRRTVRSSASSSVGQRRSLQGPRTHVEGRQPVGGNRERLHQCPECVTDVLERVGAHPVSHEVTSPPGPRRRRSAARLVSSLRTSRRRGPRPGRRIRDRPRRRSPARRHRRTSRARSASRRTVPDVRTSSTLSRGMTPNSSRMNRFSENTATYTFSGPTISIARLQRRQGGDRRALLRQLDDEDPFDRLGGNPVGPSRDDHGRERAEWATRPRVECGASSTRSGSFRP